MKDSTSKFKVIEALYDDGEFIIANGEWKNINGVWVDAMSCRWYEEGKLGFPHAYSHPAWMLLADQIKMLLRPEFARLKVLGVKPENINIS